VTADCIFALLTSSDAVNTLCPGSVHPMQLPENPTLPAATYQVVGGSSRPTLDTSGMQKLRLQVDCVGKSYLDADKLRWALVNFLNGLSGTLIDGTVLQLAQFIQPIDFAYWDDSRQFRCAAEFYFYYNFTS
jgi:Protein of unknown function (DUF3168)